MEGAGIEMHYTAVYPKALSGFEGDAHKQPCKVGVKQLVEHFAELVVVQVLWFYTLPQKQLGRLADKELLEQIQRC